MRKVLIGSGDRESHGERVDTPRPPHRYELIERLEEIRELTIRNNDSGPYRLAQWDTKAVAVRNARIINRSNTTERCRSDYRVPAGSWFATVKPVGDDEHVEYLVVAEFLGEHADV